MPQLPAGETTYTVGYYKISEAATMRGSHGVVTRISARTSPLCKRWGDNGCLIGETTQLSTFHELWKQISYGAAIEGVHFEWRLQKHANVTGPTTDSKVPDLTDPTCDPHF